MATAASQTNTDSSSTDSSSTDSSSTGSSNTEFIDVIDPATSAIVTTMPRKQAHAEGQWHRVFHCLVVRPSAESLILQQRSKNKTAFPGLLDLSATGHLTAGESVADGVREVEEELGIDVDTDNLVSLGVRLLADNSGEGQNREAVHLFFLPDERPLNSYQPEPNEVSALVEIKANDLIQILADETLSVPVTRYLVSSNSDPAEVMSLSQATISQSDLVEGADGYWTVVAVMAQRYLNGLEPIAI